MDKRFHYAFNTYIEVIFTAWLLDYVLDITFVTFLEYIMHKDPINTFGIIRKKKLIFIYSKFIFTVRKKNPYR